MCTLVMGEALWKQILLMEGSTIQTGEEIILELALYIYLLQFNTHIP